MHRAHESGTPARMTYIAQCDEKTGAFKPVQCGPGNNCWCVDERTGQEFPESRTRNGTKPNCNGRKYLIFILFRNIYPHRFNKIFCLMFRYSFSLSIRLLCY